MHRQAWGASILHLIDVAGTGGAETVFCQIARHFDACSQNAMVVLPATGWIADQLSSLRTPIVYLASKGSLSLRLLWRLGILTKQSGANVFVAHLLGSAVYTSIVGLFLRRPVVAVFHGALDFREPGRFASVKRWLLGLNHVRVIAVSDGVKDALVEWGICRSKVHVIENGIDTDEYRRVESHSLHEECGIAPSVRLIGAVGNLHPVKGYEVMIRTAASVVTRNPNVVFVIAGEGDPIYRKQLEALRDELGLGDHVRFLGFRAAGADFYSELDLLISTASSEGLPLSFLEAMSCSIPIVATANEGSTRLLQETTCGLIVGEAEPRSIADAVLRLLDDRRLAISLGSNGRRAALDRYSLATTLDRYEQLLTSVIRGGG